MEFKLTTGDLSQQSSDCIILGIFADKQLTPQASAIDSASGGYLSELLERGDITGKLKQTLLLHTIPKLNFERVLLIGLGNEKDFNEKNYIQALTSAITTIGRTKTTNVICTLTALAVNHVGLDWNIKQAIQLCRSAVYEFCQFKSNKEDNPGISLENFTFMINTQAEQAAGENAISQGKAIANGMKLTKDLANLPSNVCTPSYLAEQAHELHNAFHEIKVTVTDEKHMAKMGMGAFLAVTKGSREPAKLITLEYQGATKSEQPVALIGKGVTFDSGGISIKPSKDMDEMKYDMCGAASVFGTIRAIAEMGLSINVVGIIPATENLPGGDATKPGDVVTSLSGQTIEILNTDAEGRLILCDAITYSKRFNPAVVVDIATLTGAMIIALGNDITGVFANNDELATDLLTAGKQSYDPAWQLPLWDNYQQLLDSNFADMQNIGNRTAGSITAALFLARFSKEFSWAHLDIAGTAWKSGKSKGATARPVPLLTQYLINRCNN